MTTTGTEQRPSRPVVRRPAPIRPDQPAAPAAGRPASAVPGARRRGGARRWEALDGLRGLATTVMIAYHLGVPWLPGGVITMDMFFTLSGFLITGLLVAEYDRRGRISLSAFYSRRAKRLLPAMLVALTATVLLWRLTAEPSQLPGLRRDALSTLAYVANWHFAFDGQSYFDQLTPPSPLLHTWSLAVEEQFYLLWPILVIVFLRIGGKRLVLRAALVGALLFTALITAFSIEGVDTSRLYYGTDSRAIALLIGAALAIALPGIGRRVPRRRLLIGGLLATAWLAFEVRFSSGEAAWIYRGGFLAIALAISVVIVGLVAAPKSPLARWFRMPPWPFLGRISYGLYLFHWPIFLYVTPARTGLTGVALFGVRAALTLTCACLCWYLLERPILRSSRRIPWPRLTVPALIAGTAAAVAVAPVPHGAQAQVAGVDLRAVDAAARKTVMPRVVDVPTRDTRMLIVGDSLALTFGIAVRAGAPPYDVLVDVKGVAGCGIVTVGPTSYGGTVHDQDPSCLTWERDWQRWLAADQPDVSVLLTGRQEIADRVYHGRWTHIGDPDYDAFLSARLDHAIDLLAAGGRKVILVTEPYFNGHEWQHKTGPGPEDQAPRIDAWNDLVRAAAARHPDVVRVYDLNKLLCPHGIYQVWDDTGTVRLRTDDGIHTWAYGTTIDYLAKWLLRPARAWVPLLPSKPARVAGEPARAGGGAQAGPTDAGPTDAGPTDADTAGVRAQANSVDVPSRPADLTGR